MPTQLRRDPFAKSTLMRDFAPTRDKECAWCSQPGRFVYWWESDSNQSDRPRDLRLFCSIGCWNNWRGLEA